MAPEHVHPDRDLHRSKVESDPATDVEPNRYRAVPDNVGGWRWEKEDAQTDPDTDQVTAILGLCQAVRSALRAGVSGWMCHRFVETIVSSVRAKSGT